MISEDKGADGYCRGLAKFFLNYFEYERNHFYSLPTVSSNVNLTEIFRVGRIKDNITR